MRLAAVIGLLSPRLACAQIKQDPDYVAGFAAWQGEVSYGKSYDADYLLGTAWCRIDGLLAKGAEFLDRAMQRDMQEAAVRQFARELPLCREQLAHTSAPTQRPQMLARTSVGSGASIEARGKLYFAVNGDKGAFVANPLDLVNPLLQEESAPAKNSNAASAVIEWH